MRLVGQEKERKSDPPPARRTPPAPPGPGAEKATWLPKMPPGRTWLWLVLVLALNFWLARLLMPGPEAPVTTPIPCSGRRSGRATSRRSTLVGTLSRAA